MKPLTPYLFFDGNCREAMEFYQSCFGGELELLTYGDGPEEACPGGIKPEHKDRIMHACLSAGDFCMMASDNPKSAPVTGDNLTIAVTCENMDDIKNLFKALGVDGEITMPLDETFWARQFGMLTDRYGFRWMLNYPLEDKESNREKQTHAA